MKLHACYIKQPVLRIIFIAYPPNMLSAHFRFFQEGKHKIL